MIRHRVPVAILSCALAILSFNGCVGIFNTHSGAHGRVVDARTGTPIAGAEIIAGNAFDAKVYHTRSDGTFSVPQRRTLDVTIMALAPVDNNLFISAQGYSSMHRKVHSIPPTGSAPQENIGIIRLMPLSR